MQYEPFFTQLPGCCLDLLQQPSAYAFLLSVRFHSDGQQLANRLPGRLLQPSTHHDEAYRGSAREGNTGDGHSRGEPL
jgi:hypothetical protein